MHDEANNDSVGMENRATVAFFSVKVEFQGGMRHQNFEFWGGIDSSNIEFQGGK